MSKKIKILSSYIVLFFIFLIISKTVYAVDNMEIDNNTKGQKVESGVKVSKSSWFKVTIPKKIVLDGSKKDIYSQNYEVTIEGDLSGHETIYVEPDPNFQMIDATGRKNIYATISQDKTSFTVPKLGTLNEQTNGKVQTSKVEAGSYNGSFKFNIHKEETSTHTFGEWFDEKGYMVRYCSICGEKETKNVITYTIDYVLNSGSAINPANYNVETETFTLNNPTKTGYTFTGWTGSNGNTAQTTVTIPKGSYGNKNYTANFTESTDTKYVIYHQQEQLDGTYKTKDTENKQGTTNQEVTPDTKTYDGFTSPSKQKLTIKPDGTASLTYKYLRNSYSVVCKDYIIDKNGTKYDEITDRIELKNDSKYTQRTASVKYETLVKGSDFGGDTTKEKYNGYSYKNCSQTTVKANNTVVERYFNASFDVNIQIDGSRVDRNEVDTQNNNKQVITYDLYVDNVASLTNTKQFYGPIPYNSVVELKNIKTDSEYVIRGYYHNHQGTNTTITTPKVTMDSYRNEIYVQVDRIYKLSYTLNGGSASNKTTYTRSDADFTLTNPTKNGYTFTGWTGSNGTSAQTSVKITKGSTGNKSYTANWTPTNYTITYNLDGGSISGQKTSYNIETADFTLPTPTRTGYTFTGWTGSNGTTAQTSVKVTKGSTGNKTYTANWKINTYKVTCEDWIVDASNNRKTNVTSNISLGTDSKYTTREIIVNYGTKINASAWGSNTNRGAYTANYGYVGSNGDVTVTGNVTVYRYFYQTFDVNMLLDGVSKGTGKDGNTIIGTFDVYVNGTKTNTGVCDYCALQPYGAKVELKNIKANNGYKYTGAATLSATMGSTVTYLNPTYTKTYYVTLVAGTGIKSISGAGYYEKGASVTIDAVVQDCATWVNWTGTATTTTKKYTFTMPANAVTYTANAKANTSATTHTYVVDQNGSTAATCETDSIELQVCSKCGHSKITHNTKATGHTADTSKDKVTAATCTAQGYTTHTCKKCGKTYVDTYKNALGHNYGSDGKCTRGCGAFDMSKMAAGLYTVSGSGTSRTYAIKETWAQMLSHGYYKVENGTLKMQGLNTTTGAIQYQKQLAGFLVLDSSVKAVESTAFYGLSYLTGIYIPATMTTMNTSYRQLQGIQEIYVASNHSTLVVENGALYSKDKKTLWVAPKNTTGAFQINSSTTVIKNCAFQYAKYSSISIPSGVVTIEGGAFRDEHNITSLTIPKATTTIQDGFALSCSKLTTINVASNNPNYTSSNGIVYSKDMSQLIQVPGARTGEFNIPSSVKVIKGSAVCGCSGLTKVTIPESVTSIGGWAFASCSNITSINIPSKITRIEVGTFTPKMASITIPKNVTFIGRSNFNNSATTSVTFADTSHTWTTKLINNGIANSNIPATINVSNATQNATYFKNSGYYEWTRQ